MLWEGRHTDTYKVGVTSMPVKEASQKTSHMGVVVHKGASRFQTSAKSGEEHDTWTHCRAGELERCRVRIKKDKNSESSGTMQKGLTMTATKITL